MDKTRLVLINFLRLLTLGNHFQIGNSEGKAPLKQKEGDNRQFRLAFRFRGTYSPPLCDFSTLSKV